MKKLIIANWKMQLTIKESLELAKQFNNKINSAKKEIIICPDYAALPFIGPILKGGKLALGAQDCAAFLKGAYTGEVSALSLKALNVKYVILGHSERRENLHENSALINSKIKAALAGKLIPVLCVGEKLLEKESGQTKSYIRTELRRALKGIKIKNANELIIAYEPVWAISTNKQAKPIMPSEANAIQADIKKEVKNILKKNLRVLYGGSVDSRNVAGYLAETNIDGLLVGGASLKLSEFVNLVN